MIVDLLDGGTPLGGIFSNIIRLAVSKGKDLGDVTACNLGGQRECDNILSLLTIVKFVTTGLFRDDYLDVAKFAASARSQAECEAGGDFHGARWEDGRCRRARESCRGPVCGVSVVAFLRLLFHHVDIEALQNGSNFTL